MSTETDAYGMSADERAAFEVEFPFHADGDPFSRAAARGWAACAKLCRDQLSTRDDHIKEIETKVEQLKKELIEKQKYILQLERNTPDKYRMDYISGATRCDPKMDGQHYWWNPRLCGLRGSTLREAIDNAMKENENPNT